MPALFALVAWLDARRGLSEFVLWGLALWGLLHMVGGLVPATDDRVAYEVWLLPVLRFDHIVHAVGFGFAGLAVCDYLRPVAGAGAALVLIGGIGLGGVNEMIEFLISRVIEDTNIGGFENTAWDLVANFVGASAAASWVRFSGYAGWNG